MNDLRNERLWKAGAIELFEKSDAYKILIEPLKKEIEEMKPSYKCKTLQEMSELKGKYEGLNFILDLIESIKTDGNVIRETKTEIESSEEPTII